MTDERTCNKCGEELKQNFELEFRKILRNKTSDDYDSLTFGSKTSKNQKTLEELNKIIHNCFDLAVSYHKEITFYNPRFVLDTEKLEVRVIYEH